MTIDVCTPRNDPPGSYPIAPTPLTSFDLPDVPTPTKPMFGFQGSDGPRGQHAMRAGDAFAALQRAMVADDGATFDAREGSDACDRSWVWPNGQLVAASLDSAIITKDVSQAERALAGLERYLLPNGSFNASAGRDDDRYYDDNAWVGLDLAQAFRLTGDQKYVDGARKVFDFLMQGTNDAGGVLWHEKNEPGMRPAAATGPTLQLALQLHAMTGDQTYMDAAKKVSSYLDTLRTGPNGMVIDARSDDGSSNTTLFAYNQGTAIGADLQMYEALKHGSTQEQAEAKVKLARATSLANATLDHFNDAELWKQAPAFNAILFRNLLKLDIVAPNPRIRATLQRYLDHADSVARTPDGLYRGAGLAKTNASGPDDATALIDQSAFVQLHALMAMTPGQLQSVA
jgi:predicted alpha-1,6-mannanase (GH76 family)